MEFTLLSITFSHWLLTWPKQHPSCLETIIIAVSYHKKGGVLTYVLVPIYKI